MPTTAHADPWTVSDPQTCLGTFSASTPDAAFDEIAAAVHACFQTTTWVKTGPCVIRSDESQTPAAGVADCPFNSVLVFGSSTQITSFTEIVQKVCGNGPHIGSSIVYPYYDSVTADCVCVQDYVRLDDGMCHAPEYYLIKPPPKKSDPPCKNETGSSPPKVGEPINVATGAVVSVEGDCKASINGPLSFTRYYDSSDLSGTNLGPGWRGSFSRHVVAQTTVAVPRTYDVSIGAPPQSSKYSSAASACTSGFVELKAGVPDWSGATTQYVEGICELIKNGLVIGSIPVYSTFGVPLPLTFPTPVIYNFVRDDGQIIRSWKQNSVLRGSAGMSLRVTQSPSSFTYIDNNDNVELYGVSGTLQSVTGRAGVVQTMGYDAQGRLSTVTDSFGHRLTFGYDAQNRLSSVTRQ